jgi:hypothetical protein
MNTTRLTNLKHYVDRLSLRKNEPGIYHSYMSSLATSLSYISGGLDPVWIMGSSIFAFRIFVNETLCPSAMSMFSFKEILPEAIEQAGYNCKYVERMWDESVKEEEKRIEAHNAVVEAIQGGIPPVVWDIFDVEWGLIIGYDDIKESYFTLSHQGKVSSLPYKKLGKNGIDILSVSIPGEPNFRSRERVIINALNAAVAHSEGKEWIDDRPTYQNGIKAFDLWASVFDKWSWIVANGKSDKIGLDIFYFANYYAGHYYSARCYARDFLRHIAEEDKNLTQASLAYGRVADFLRPIWLYFSERKKPDSKLLKSFAQNIDSAKKSEKEGIELIKKYLNKSTLTSKAANIYLSFKVKRK